MTVLHINSSARLSNSNTRIIGQYLVDALAEPTISRDLAQQPLPTINAEDLMAVHSSSASDSASLKAQLSLSEQLIDELRNADTLILAAPMYNFGIPATLKQWIDSICRAGVSFKYTEQGPVGLLGIKRAFIITASGGTPVGSEMDFASRYLEHICKFIGIGEVFHIDASGSKGTPEQVIAQGKRQVDVLVSTLLTNAFTGEA
ncbi:FMN-dependent NADH-azoreductase [Oceanisphaera sp. W20_SRM_FM3]|uniref:FMN-dependent NADH-azoreductase n=1 Tax=Oceanisphaera sp. W20_SRM_FM3 TaxID=3240267 RepID=UPI003F949BAF